MSYGIVVSVPYRVSKSTNAKILLQIRELPTLSPYPPVHSGKGGKGKIEKKNENHI